MRDDPEKPYPGEPYPGKKARQGDILLRKGWQRIVFIAGLVGFVLLVIALTLAPSA